MADPVPSLEADLRAAREAAGVSVETIQHETRIPADVVERFEAGRLIGDDSFNEVYLKAFVKAYAEAIGLSGKDAQAAYAAARAGRYEGQLRPDYTPGTTPPAPEEPPPSAVAAPPAPASETPQPESAEAETVDSPPRRTEITPAEALSGPPPEETPKPAPVPPAPAPRPRPRMGAAAPTGGSLGRSWGLILGIAGVMVLAIVAVLWLLFRSDRPEPDEALVAVTPDTTEVVADTAEAAPEATPAPALALPIRVTVLAGGDGLQNFRVTEAPNERLGHWVEPGDAVTYESGEALILWGEGAEGMDPDEVTLRWQGFEWQPPDGQILRIDPTNGPRLLDSLATAGVRRVQN